jgi:hypothetical protein
MSCRSRPDGWEEDSDQGSWAADNISTGQMYTGNAHSHHLPWKGYTRMMFMVSVANELGAQCTLLCFAMLADEVQPSGMPVRCSRNAAEMHA